MSGALNPDRCIDVESDDSQFFDDLPQLTRPLQRTLGALNCDPSAVRGASLVQMLCGAQVDVQRIRMAIDLEWLEG